ncbi:MAG: DUF1330 domain-containing protein [Alphaproteobacteria bacterium]|nr:DUF1330 domain-containing protein [Alphaproteobacteria bacterium]
MAKGYMVVHLEVTDPKKFEEYRGKVPATIAQYGGKYLVRGGDMETMEGAPLPARTVILEFPNVEQAKIWYHSPEYQAIIGLRLGASTGNAQIVEGLD